MLSTSTVMLPSAVIDAAASRGEAPAARARRCEILDRDAALIERNACVEIDEGDTSELVLEAAVDDFDVAVAGEIASAELDFAFAVKCAFERLIRQARGRPQARRRDHAPTMSRARAVLAPMRCGRARRWFRQARQLRSARLGRSSDVASTVEVSRVGLRLPTMCMSSEPRWRPETRASSSVTSASPLRPPPSLASETRPSMRPVARSPKIAARGAIGASSICARAGQSTPALFPLRLHDAVADRDIDGSLSAAGAPINADWRARVDRRIGQRAAAFDVGGLFIEIDRRSAGKRQRRLTEASAQSNVVAIASSGPSACRVAARTRRSPAHCVREIGIKQNCLWRQRKIAGKAAGEPRHKAVEGAVDVEFGAETPRLANCAEPCASKPPHCASSASRPRRRRQC
jgi:hypothetical protein